jgi:iron complex outermembrane receptor protein
VTFFDAGGGPVTANAGEVTIQGLELEVNALVTDGLLFELGYGYTDAEYDSINEIPGLALAITEDSALVNTPEHTLNYAYSDEIFNDSQNSPFLFQDSYSLVNASATYTINYDWDITLFVENLTDERVLETGNSNFGLGFHEARFNRPREYGVTVRYKF